MSRKKIKFSERRHNLATWFKHPSFLIGFISFVALFTLTIGLAFPCGKYNSPVHGVCSNGEPFWSPLAYLAIGAVIALLLSVIVAAQSPNDGDWSNKKFLRGLFSQFSKRPKWYRRWYPIAFLVAYAPLAIFNYYLDIDGGLRWYNYVGQYALILPLLAFLPASWMLTQVRRLTRKR